MNNLIIKRNKHDKYYEYLLERYKTNDFDVKLYDDFNVKKILHYLNVLHNNYSNIYKINLVDYCYKFDYKNPQINNFFKFDAIYNIKDTHNKKHYIAFNKKIDVLTIEELKVIIFKMYKVWIETRNIKYKYFMKFLRRINFNKISKIYLIISTKKINEFDDLNNILKYTTELATYYKNFPDYESFCNIIDIKVSILG